MMEPIGSPLVSAAHDVIARIIPSQSSARLAARGSARWRFRGVSGGELVGLRGLLSL